jgi:hypothetical protein
MANSSHKKKSKKDDKMNDFLKATANSVDSLKGDMAKMKELHAADLAKMKDQMQQMQRIVVDKMGDNNNKRNGDGEKKKRKKQEFIVNYYVVAFEFFNKLCPLKGSIQKTALGQAGVNAWLGNKEELKTWFKENDLDLANKLKMVDIRTTIEEKNLIKEFEDHFPELTVAIKEAKEVTEEEDSSSGGESDE